MMTAHILLPSLDEQRPATLSPRVVDAMLRRELGYEGVILSDDLEMKAIERTYAVGEAAIQAIAAGCDGVLICSGNLELQAATLEALVHAVEDGRIPFKRAEDALARQRRAKERFLSAPVVPAQQARLQSVLGCDEHQRIADEMARFI
jgi:beta-N-acetylhexosaminidase